MRKERKQDETLAREIEAWRLRASGLTQTAVAERIGISQPGVCKLLARVSERLKAEFTEEVLSAKLEQSAILSHIAQEALGAWRESKKDAELLRDTEKWIVPKDGGEPYQLTDHTRERRGQAGDAALLSAAMKALGDIRSIWGLDSPKVAEVSGPQGGPIEFASVGRTLDSKIHRLAAYLAQGAAAGEPDAGGEGEPRV